MTKLHLLSLKFYPADIREEFGEQMATVFEQAVAGRRGFALLCLVFRELAGTITAGMKARLFPRSARPDDSLAFPTDIPETERYLQVVSKRLIHAIAHHDFSGARYYDAQERQARQLLAQLRSQPN